MDQSITSKHTLETKLPQDVRAMVRVIMMRAEYRQAETLHQKVDILHTSKFSIPFATACKVVGVSTKTYYKNKRLIELNEPELDKTPSRQLLTKEEENAILEMILRAQLKLCGADVRGIASDLYKKRTQILRTFERQWLKDFLRRHAYVIAKKRCPSVDDDRAELNRERIE